MMKRSARPLRAKAPLVTVSQRRSRVSLRNGAGTEPDEGVGGGVGMRCRRPARGGAAVGQETPCNTCDCRGQAARGSRRPGAVGGPSSSADARTVSKILHINARCSILGLGLKPRVPTLERTALAQENKNRAGFPLSTEVLTGVGRHSSPPVSKDAHGGRDRGSLYTPRRTG